MTSATATQPPTVSRTFRFSMFAMLYFVQGAGLAYFRNFQKPYLAGFGIDVDAIGWFTTLLLLPFVIKVFFGMFSDRVALFGMGHRKPYIMIGLVLAAVGFGAAGFLSPDVSFLPFALVVLLGSFSVAFFDSTTDGLAVDITPDAEQGATQSTMVAGRAIGFIILSLVFGGLVQAQGYRVMFLIIGAMMLLPFVWLLRFNEGDSRPETRTFDWGAFRALLTPRFGVFALYAIVYSFVAFGVDGLVTFFLDQVFDAPETVLGTYGALRGVGAVIGAAGAGLIFARLGRLRSAYLAVLLVIVGAALIGLAPDINTVLVLGVVWGIMWGFQEAVFLALAMHISDTRIAASMFALMMALSNVGTAIGEGVATGLTDNMSFTMVFIVMAAINVLVLPIVWGLGRVAPEFNAPLAEQAR